MTVCGLSQAQARPAAAAATGRTQPRQESLSTIRWDPCGARTAIAWYAANAPACRPLVRRGHAACQCPRVWLAFPACRCTLRYLLNAACLVQSAIPSSVPKRMRRILANRASAARSKERKKAIIELEEQVAELQQQQQTQENQMHELRTSNATLGASCVPLLGNLLVAGECCRLQTGVLESCCVLLTCRASQRT